MQQRSGLFQKDQKQNNHVALNIPSTSDSEDIINYLQAIKVSGMDPKSQIQRIVKLLENYNYQDSRYPQVIKLLDQLGLLEKNTTIFSIIAEHPEEGSAIAIYGYSRGVPYSICQYWGTVSDIRYFQSRKTESWKEDFQDYFFHRTEQSSEQKQFAAEFLKRIDEAVVINSPKKR